jgi:hypothetical protein
MAIACTNALIQRNAIWGSTVSVFRVTCLAFAKTAAPKMPTAATVESAPLVNVGWAVATMATAQMITAARKINAVIRATSRTTFVVPEARFATGSTVAVLSAYRIRIVAKVYSVTAKAWPV